MNADADLTTPENAYLPGIHCLSNGGYFMPVASNTGCYPMNHNHFPVPRLLVSIAFIINCAPG